MYKIFINNKPLIITTNLDREKQANEIIIDNDDITQIKMADRLLLENKYQAAVILTPNPDKVFESLYNIYQPITAAGGVVVNDLGEKLLIFRNKLWDLPKGKLEDNETIEQGALREVYEECGIKDLVIVQQLSPTYHCYFSNGKRLLKTTYWFLMKLLSSDFNPNPQLEEGITKVKFFDDKTIATLNDIYPSIKSLLTENVKS